MAPPEFPGHSFSALRDTASDRIRHIAGGEIASVFLCHGKPVKEDDLLDVYTNRPFADVFRALRQLERDLKPMFDAAPNDPWATPMQHYTSLGTRERILDLHRQGMKAPEIAKLVTKAPATIDSPARMPERMRGSGVLSLKDEEVESSSCSDLRDLRPHQLLDFCDGRLGRLLHRPLRTPPSCNDLLAGVLADHPHGDLGLLFQLLDVPGDLGPMLGGTPTAG